MQRPRRTSEFQDDSACVRRLSRSQQKNTLAPSPSTGSGMVAACVGTTSKKYIPRQSRIAIPTRPSSNDRSSSNPHLLVPPSTVQRGVTPQKTPLPKTSANRVLFTAEKQRPTQPSNVPLHNDKKWVQERTQRITEHLLSQSKIGGMNTDFLNRGLRQMSIKQFVAIINYFLGYIWGNRFIVGNNHVEDIINILQKLKYPYSVNKSWLKTPNTQHSFGNVIVLLDFLMDFVPHNEEDTYLEELYFDLKNPDDFSTLNTNEESFQIPDLEFQRKLLTNSEKGFLLWDKQKIEEFASLKQQTCNILLQKKCGVSGLEEIETEIEKSKEILKSLESERPHEDREIVKKKSQLSRDFKNLSNQIKNLQDECETNERDIKELSSQKMIKLKEVSVLQREIQILNETLKTQSCTIEERDVMIANVMQHKQMLAIKERTIQDLQNRYHNEQILKSKNIKQLNDQIEAFNAHMREIKFSNLIKFDSNSSLNDDNLELSLRPQQTDVNRLKIKLDEINHRALQIINDNNEKIFRLQEHCKQLKIDIDAKLYTRLNTLRTTNSSNAANLEKLDHSLKKDECELQEIITKLDEDLVTADNTIKELQALIKKKKSLVEDMIQANEQTMRHAEEKHQQRLEQRKAFLKAYEEVLEECIQSDALQQLEKQVELQEKQLDDLKKVFNQVN